MWTVRILKGPKAGMKFELQNGDNLVGRAPHCQICINTPGLSKEHALISVNEHGVFLTDLNSTNGTFINGIKVQTQQLRLTDKITLFDTILGFEDNTAHVPANVSQAPFAAPMAYQDSQAAVQFDPSFAQPQMHGGNPSKVDTKPTFFTVAKNYIDNVLLPGVYKLPEITDFKLVVGGFILAFALIVTALSVIPMVELTKSGIERESQRRALSLAKSLADRYQIAHKNGVESAFNSAPIEREQGVTAAYILSSSDGTVVAPAKRVGQRPNEQFVHSARRSDQQEVSQMNSATVGAAIPIKTFDSETGSFRVSYHAVVIYDMGSMAIDTGRIIGLVIRVLAIAMVVGALLFFFLYKLFEFPLVQINKQVNEGLKDGNTLAKTNYRFEILQSLVSNINTAIERASQAKPDSRQVVSDRSREASQLVENYPGAAIAIDKNQSVISMNIAFEELVGLRLNDVQGQNYASLNDHVLTLNLKDLIEQTEASGYSVVTGQIDFNGRSTTIVLQPIQEDHGVSYYLFSFRVNDQGGF